MTSWRRRATYGLAAYGAATVMWTAVKPSEKSLTPAGQQQQHQDAYTNQREREVEEMRRRGIMISEVDRLDRMRPAEVRPVPRDSAPAVARGLLRRVP